MILSWPDVRVLGDTSIHDFSGAVGPACRIIGNERVRAAVIAAHRRGIEGDPPVTLSPCRVVATGFDTLDTSIPDSNIHATRGEVRIQRRSICNSQELDKHPRLRPIAEVDGWIVARSIVSDASNREGEIDRRMAVLRGEVKQHEEAASVRRDEITQLETERDSTRGRSKL